MYFITFLMKNNFTSHSLNQNVSRWTTASSNEDRVALNKFRHKSCRKQIITIFMWNLIAFISFIRYPRLTCMLIVRQTTLIILCAKNITMKAMRTGTDHHFLCAPNVYSIILMKYCLIGTCKCRGRFIIWRVPFRRKT